MVSRIERVGNMEHLPNVYSEAISNLELWVLDELGTSIFSLNNLIKTRSDSVGDAHSEIVSFTDFVVNRRSDVIVGFNTQSDWQQIWLELTSNRSESSHLNFLISSGQKLMMMNEDYGKELTNKIAEAVAVNLPSPLDAYQTLTDDETKGRMDYDQYVTFLRANPWAITYILLTHIPLRNILSVVGAIALPPGVANEDTN